MIHIVYPDDRWLSDDYVLTRYADAVANGQIPGSQHWPQPKTALEAARELEDIGQIALHKEQTKGVIVEDLARKAGVPVVKSPPVFVAPEDYKGFPFTPASPGVQKAAMNMVLDPEDPVQTPIITSYDIYPGMTKKEFEIVQRALLLFLDEKCYLYDADKTIAEDLLKRLVG